MLDGLRWAYPYRLAGVPGRPGDTVTIEISGPVSRAWRLLTSNLPAAGRDGLALFGDSEITGTLLHTRAIIGAPTWS